MKVLIFSDSHLDEDFDEYKFKFLERIISEADKVIINGDLWDGYFTSFDKFISSQWKGLFPLLKKKGAVYIYGNHDPKRFADERVSLFSDIQAEEYEIKVGDFTYRIEHGNHLDIALNRFDKKFFHYRDPKSWRFNILKYIDAFFELYSLVFRKPLITPLSGASNQEIKPQLKEKLQKNTYFVFGHTHYGEVDLEYNFINTGVVLFGLGQYLMVDESGFEFLEERYRK